MHDKKLINNAIKVFLGVFKCHSTRKKIIVDREACEVILNSSFYKNIKFINRHNEYLYLYLSKRAYLYTCLERSSRNSGYNKSCFGYTSPNGFTHTILGAKRLSEIIAGFPSFAVYNR